MPKSFICIGWQQKETEETPTQKDLKKELERKLQKAYGRNIFFQKVEKAN